MGQLSQSIDDHNAAQQFETEYKWLDAIAQYTKRLKKQDVTKRDHLNKARIHERIGFCYQRAAYQSNENATFKARIRSAQQSYQKATDQYSRANETESKAKMLNCLSQSTYLESLLKEDPQERMNHLTLCLDHAEKALEEWKKTTDTLGYINTSNQLLSYLHSKLELAQNHKEVIQILGEALEYSTAAIRTMDENAEIPELTWTRHLLSLILLDKPMEVYGSIEKQQEAMKISYENAQRAYNEAEKLGDLYLLGRTCGVLSYVTFEINGDLETSLKLTKIQLESAEKTGDKLLKAQANELNGYLIAWKTNYTNEDPETQNSENTKALQYSKDALAYYEIITKPVVYAYLNHVGSYYLLARNEHNTEKKLEILSEGVQVAKKDLKNARKSGSQLGLLFILNELTHLLFRLIQYEVDEEKRRLIDETEHIVEELIEVSARMQPFRYWNQSVFKFHSATLKIERSRFEKDQQKQVELLKEALREGDECVELGKIHLSSNPSTTLFLDYALGLMQLGSLLDHIYSVTKDTQYLERAINTYRQALNTYEENDLNSRAAETYWKIANSYNLLGQFLESAWEFESASSSYENAAKKLPHQNEFYIEYSNYMKAWSEIKQAKHYNLEKQYDKVKEHYERAAELHKSTKRWGYLSKNYLAWARIAEAEALSQKDRTVDAKNLFHEIAQMFEDSKKTIESHRRNIDVKDEQLMADSLLEASEFRQKYCQGRIALEEARILNRQGEHAASSQKYDASTRIFQNIEAALDTESERAEITPIILLCKAWKMMALAEAEASPQRYHEASLLFEKAKESSYTQKTRLLAMGHSNFCKGLYESTQFEATRAMDNYQIANQYLTNAANYYVRAGYDNAFEYSKATQRLIDAYVYMDIANKETDPERKARYFTMTEKVLEDSAKSYSKARYQAKREEVNKILRNVRKERKFALDLVDILNAPLISSTTDSFNVPTPSQEYAAGLDSFEHANIQAHLYLLPSDLKSGKTIGVTLELYNAGKVAASLMKVEEIVSENIVLDSVSGFYAITDQCINLKGRKLGPLNTETISFSVMPLKKGVYVMKPRIVYINDVGEEQSCEPEPVRVKVTEMGILGWLRGPRP